jgi:hypothetical protein
VLPPLLLLELLDVLPPLLLLELLDVLPPLLLLDDEPPAEPVTVTLRLVVAVPVAPTQEIV